MNCLIVLSVLIVVQSAFGINLNQNGSVYCDFEDKTPCDWKTGGRWRLINGRQQPNTTFPKTDHSLATPDGHFLVALKHYEKVALETSAWLPFSDYSSHPICLTFWYYFNPTSVDDQIRIIAKRQSGDQFNPIKFVIKEGTVGEWSFAKYTLNVWQSNLVGVEAIQSSEATVAIDDLCVANGNCNYWSKQL